MIIDIIFIVIVCHPFDARILHFTTEDLPSTLQDNKNPSIACLIVVDIEPLLILVRVARDDNRELGEGQ